jgi:hypothetical protein
VGGCNFMWFVRLRRALWQIATVMYQIGCIWLMHGQQFYARQICTLPATSSLIQVFLHWLLCPNFQYVLRH